MPTSNFMADVSVEIAFGSGFSTPAASRTWTDVSTYVELHEGITISAGRSDERATTDANQLTLTLDNRDGRFTAGKTSGAYYPDVKLDTPIRVLADPVDGVASVRFLGYVNEWPIEWEGTDAYAKATITASSSLARLGLVSTLASIIETEILMDEPTAYYTLGEPEGSIQAADTSGNGEPPLTMVGSGAAVTFGTATGPGTDDLTAAQFNNGKYLQVPRPTTTPAGVTLEAFFLCATNPPHDAVLVSTGGVNLGLNSFGHVTATIGGTGSGSGVDLCDGQTHHAAATWNGTTLRLYVDGTEVDNDAVAGSPSLGTISSGYGLDTTNSLEGFTGVVAHLAVYDSVLSATRILAHADAGLNGFAGDLTDERLERYAVYGGIDPNEVHADGGSTTMGHVDTTGQQVVEMLRMCETTEGGVLFDQRDGALRLQGRAHRYELASLYTLNMAEQEVEADYAPKFDRSAVLNDVEAQNVAGTVSARRRDTASINAYGVASDSVTTASEDEGEPLQIASWRTSAYAEPKTRVPTLSVDCLAQVGKTPNCAAVMATNIGDKITVSNHPTQMAATSSDYFVEGWIETYGPESLVMTFNVSPTSPWDEVWILGDPVRGELGTARLAY